MRWDQFSLQTRISGMAFFMCLILFIPALYIYFVPVTVVTADSIIVHEPVYAGEMMSYSIVGRHKYLPYPGYTIKQLVDGVNITFPATPLSNTAVGQEDRVGYLEIPAWVPERYYSFVWTGIHNVPFRWSKPLRLQSKQFIVHKARTTEERAK